MRELSISKKQFGFHANDWSNGFIGGLVMQVCALRDMRALYHVRRRAEPSFRQESGVRLWKRQIWGQRLNSGSPQDWLRGLFRVCLHISFFSSCTSIVSILHLLHSSAMCRWEVNRVGSRILPFRLLDPCRTLAIGLSISGHYTASHPKASKCSS